MVVKIKVTSKGGCFIFNAICFSLRRLRHRRYKSFIVSVTRVLIFTGTAGWWSEGLRQEFV